MHWKFKELMNDASPEDKEKVNRAINNSKKKKSSASLGGSGNSIVKNESDLTPDDVVNMGVEKWQKDTRLIILKGIRE